MTKNIPEELQKVAENLLTELDKYDDCYSTARGAILLSPLDRALSVITRCDACPEPCPCRRCIGEEEARCGDICHGCRGSKFCGKR